jgi:hypothetical protein
LKRFVCLSLTTKPNMFPRGKAMGTLQNIKHDKRMFYDKSQTRVTI